MTDANLDGFIPIDLPSKFLPYREKELFVRPLKTAEVKRLTPIIRSGKLGGLLDVLAPVVRPVRITDLTLGDFWYVAAWLRLNTFKNSPLHREWTCQEPSCRAKNTHEIDLSEHPIAELPAEYREPALLKLPSGMQLPVRYPRIGDSRIAESFVKTVEGKDLVGEEDTALAELALTIMNGKDLPDNIKLLEGLEPEDVLYLEEFQRDFSHGLESIVKVQCGGCGSFQEIRIWFHVTDLVPAAGARGRTRDSVCFGESAASE